MKKEYNIFYNDGAYYGKIAFNNDVPQVKIETLIQSEIDSNNKNINSLYKITRDNFVLIK